MNLEKAILRSTNQTQKTNHTIVFCPLCSTQRKMRYSSKLSILNYLQIILVSGVLAYFLFPIMREKSVVITLVVWMFFETTNKLLYRKSIPCDECGFDATWYRKDVKVARKKVADFWQESARLKEVEQLAKNPIKNIVTPRRANPEISANPQ